MGRKKQAPHVSPATKRNSQGSPVAKKRRRDEDAHTLLVPPPPVEDDTDREVTVKFDDPSSESKKFAFTHKHGETEGNVIYDHTIFVRASSKVQLLRETKPTHTNDGDGDDAAEGEGPSAEEQSVEAADYQQIVLPINAVENKIVATLDHKNRTLSITYNVASEDGEDAKEVSQAVTWSEFSPLAICKPNDVKLGFSIFARNASIQYVAL